MTRWVDGLVSFQRENARTSVGLGQDSSRRVDFLFDELKVNIIGGIGAIYASFYPDQPPPTPEAIAKFEAYLVENCREVKGNQRRNLVDFSLSEKEVSFEEYSRIFLADGVTRMTCKLDPPKGS